MPPSSGSEPQSPDGQAARKATRVWSEWAAPPTPNTRRRITEHHGTWAWYTAASARAPWRIVAARSASTPMTKPGWSTRCTTGRWNVSASSTKASIFIDESAVRPPP